MMKKWILNNKMYFIGGATGAVGGFLYWNYIGCLSGTCAITSDPVNSTVYFAIVGSVLFGGWKRKRKDLPAETDQPS